MKKATSKNRPPSRASLKAMPEVDFRRARVGRNPYADRVAREGIELVHDEPSPGSLVEMPEADFSKARLRRNPYPAATEVRIKSRPGRPKRGQEVGTAPAKSVRLPVAVWHALEAVGKSESKTVHALLREAVVEFLERRADAGTLQAYVAVFLSHWQRMSAEGVAVSPSADRLDRALEPFVTATFRPREVVSNRLDAKIRTREDVDADFARRRILERSQEAN